MILNASGRTDICAFYAEWFARRIRAGYFDVRNPFYEKSVSRIYWQDVDAVMFCTKNPIPMLPYLDLIDKPILMDVTITAYHKDLEPGVLPKKNLIEAVKVLSMKLGKEQVIVRYDPILLSPRYDVSYHLRAFEKLCSELDGFVSEICISFLDEYKNVRRHQQELDYHLPGAAEYRSLAEGFLASAARHGIHIYTCAEKNVLKAYGIADGSCFAQEKAFAMTGKVFGKWKARDCSCVEMADIGAYNTCLHHCKYCYANYDEKAIAGNLVLHDPQSSLLIGHLQPDDIIKVRKA